MPYAIEYFREGEKIGLTPWAASLDFLIEAARFGLDEFGADYFRIVTVSSQGAEVRPGSQTAAKEIPR